MPERSQFYLFQTSVFGQVHQPRDLPEVQSDNPTSTYIFWFFDFFIDSSCFKDVAKYDCSVFIYLLYRINWWHTPLWWVVLYVSKNCGSEKKSEYPYRYWEVMILSALSTYYILGFIKKTPSRNVFAKTLLNRLSVGCSLSSNETRSDQCLVAAGQRAALCWDWGRGINSPRFRIKHLWFVWAVVMFFQKNVEALIQYLTS